MKNVNFSLLKPEEIHALALRLLPILEAIIPDDVLLRDLYPRLHELTNDLSRALGLGRTSKFTTRLLEADNQRDRLFLGLRHLVVGFTFHPDQQLARAARVLETLIQSRGVSLQTYGYIEESSQLNGLLADLKSPAAQQAIATIQLEFMVDVLAQAQEEFEAIYQQKVASEAVQNLPGITASKRDLTRYLTRVFQYIDTQAEINAEKYGSVVEKIDEVIVDVMTIARARKTKQEDSKANGPQ